MLGGIVLAGGFAMPLSAQTETPAPAATVPTAPVGTIPAAPMTTPETPATPAPGAQPPADATPVPNATTPTEVTPEAAPDTATSSATDLEEVEASLQLSRERIDALKAEIAEMEGDRTRQNAALIAAGQRVKLAEIEVTDV
ncbi:MAG: hypothetical protein EOO80_20000, partial [Oxalobacteraceae bacterium]